MAEKDKIFDDYTPVDCNQCEAWWLNTCEGVKKGSEKRCTAFKAVRRVDIPLEIESLRKAVKRLRMAGLLVSASFLIHLVVYIFGG